MEIIPIKFKNKSNIDFTLEIIVKKCNYYKNIDFTFKIFAMKIQYLNILHTLHAQYGQIVRHPLIAKYFHDNIL